MPKENTHLHFANKARKINLELLGIIDSNIKYYYLGSVFPDTLLYSKRREVKDISNTIHGIDGTSPNEMIFHLLDKAKENKDEKLFVFVLGLLTHHCLDRIFHPIIMYLTGNIYAGELSKRRKAIYRHRRIEIHLDRKINKEHYYEDLVDKNLFTDKDVVGILSRYLNIAQKDIEKSFNRQFFYNKLFRNKFFAHISRILHMTGMYKLREYTSFFYNDVQDDITFPDNVEYRNLFTGVATKTNIEELFQTADIKIEKAFMSAYKYCNDEESRENAEINISNENLDTGSKDYTVKDIKFVLE